MGVTEAAKAGWAWEPGPALGECGEKGRKNEAFYLLRLRKGSVPTSQVRREEKTTPEWVSKELGLVRGYPTPHRAQPELSEHLPRGKAWNGCLSN